MASRRVRLVARPFVVALLVGGGAFPLLSSTPAAADVSQQIAAAQAQLNALNNRAERASEAYDAARLAYTQAEQKVGVAQDQLKRTNAHLAQVRVQIGSFAASQYENGSLSATNLLAMNASDFLDHARLVDEVSVQQQQLLDEASAAQLAQRAAINNEQSAVSSAQQALSQANHDRAVILKSVGQARALLSSLQAKEAQIVATARAAAARRAALARAAELAAQQRAMAVAAAAFSRQSAAPAAPAYTPPVDHSGSPPSVAVKWAYSELGKPYVYGAAGPDSFDCSGLTQYVWAKAGVYLPHYTGAQYGVGRHVSMSQLQPGDLVFFYSDVHHVGIYVGGGNFIHAPHTGTVVQVASLSGYYAQNFAGAVRVWG